MCFIESACTHVQVEFGEDFGNLESAYTELEEDYAGGN